MTDREAIDHVPTKDKHDMVERDCPTYILTRSGKIFSEQSNTFLHPYVDNLVYVKALKAKTRPIPPKQYARTVWARPFESLGESDLKRLECIQAPDHYVTKTGVVYHNSRKTGKSVVLYPHVNRKTGYLMVSISNGHGSKQYPIHELVGRNWLPQRDGYRHIVFTSNDITDPSVRNIKISERPVYYKLKTITDEMVTKKLLYFINRVLVERTMTLHDLFIMHDFMSWPFLVGIAYGPKFRKYLGERFEDKEPKLITSQVIKELAIDLYNSGESCELICRRLQLPKRDLDNILSRSEAKLTFNIFSDKTYLTDHKINNKSPMEF